MREAQTSGLVQAIEGNFQGWLALASVLPGAEVRREEDCTWFRTYVPHPHLNGVIEARFAPETLELRIAQLTARFDAEALPMDWWLLPSSRPAGLARHLAAHGFHRGGDWPGMAADLNGIASGRTALSGFRCAAVETDPELDLWMDVHAGAFATPDAERAGVDRVYRELARSGATTPRHYIGWYRGMPVSVASLFLAAGVAGVYNIGTLPCARGRGIGREMTLEALREAVAAGHRVGVLGASQMGLPVYRRLGFNEYCRLRWMERPVGHARHGRAHRPVRMPPALDPPLPPPPADRG